MARKLAGCCAWIAADVAREIPAGDHSIVIGAITAVGMGAGPLPLAFARGRLGRVEAVTDQESSTRYATNHRIDRKDVTS